MSTLTGFFKGSGTHLGVFHPNDYLIAVFPVIEAARLSERRLLDSGFQPDEVTAVPGSEVIRLAAEHTHNHGLGSMLMQMLSRVFQTEEVYLDHDLELAYKGAAFLMVHCPSEKSKATAWEHIKPGRPLMARHYSFGGIEHLTGES